MLASGRSRRTCSNIHTRTPQRQCNCARPSSTHRRALQSDNHPTKVNTLHDQTLGRPSSILETYPDEAFPPDHVAHHLRLPRRAGRILISDGRRADACTRAGPGRLSPGAGRMGLRPSRRPARSDRLPARLSARARDRRFAPRHQALSRKLHPARLGLLPTAAEKMLWPRIDDEYRREIDGIVAGLKPRGSTPTDGTSSP